MKIKLLTFFSLLLFSNAFAQTLCSSGFAGVYPCNKIDLMARFSLIQLGGTASTEGNDCWGWTDPLNGKEYAIMSCTTHTALARADIGIAMGTETDVAIESAKITLVKGDLQGIVKAKNLSHAVMKNIKQNLFFAFFYNVLGIPIAAGVLYPFFGVLLSPMIAALAMSFSSVSVIANALRLRNLRL